VINADPTLLNGEFKFSENSEPVKFEFLPIDFGANEITEDAGSA